ncbi:MAG: hypothetical protein KBF88_16540 [Polyangiaceae bacterium]|nr:hypothetical protein [Polyangiaceae bacterium]
MSFLQSSTLRNGLLTCLLGTLSLHCSSAGEEADEQEATEDALGAVAPGLVLEAPEGFTMAVTLFPAYGTGKVSPSNARLELQRGKEKRVLDCSIEIRVVASQIKPFLAQIHCGPRNSFSYMRINMTPKGTSWAVHYYLDAGPLGAPTKDHVIFGTEVAKTGVKNEAVKIVSRTKKVNSDPLALAAFFKDTLGDEANIPGRPVDADEVKAAGPFVDPNHLGFSFHYKVGGFKRNDWCGYGSGRYLGKMYFSAREVCILKDPKKPEAGLIDKAEFEKRFSAAIDD